MGALIALLLFVTLKNIATASEHVPVSSKTLQAPDLMTSSLKYSSQEYHLPSHALCTITPKPVPAKPSKMIYVEPPPTVSEFVTQTNTIIPREYLSSNVMPMFQDNTDGFKLATNPQVFKEITINTPTPRQCTRLEEISLPPIVLSENTPEDIKIPHTEYLPKGQPRSQSTPVIKQMPVTYINQNQINIIDPQNIPQIPQYREVYIDGNGKDRSSTGNVVCPKSYNKQDLSKNLLSAPYYEPYTPSIAPEPLQTVTNPHSRLSIPCHSDKPVIVNYQTLPPKDHIVDAMSYLPQPTVTKDSKNNNKDCLKILDNINELLLNYGIVTQRDSDKSKIINSPPPEIDSKLNKYQPKIVLCPSTDTITNAGDVCQKGLQVSKIKETQKSSINNIDQSETPKQFYYITEPTPNTIENSLPRYKIGNNVITFNVSNEAALRTPNQGTPYKPFVQNQTDYNNEEGKGNPNISKQRNDISNIKNQIEKIKKKYHSISSSVPSVPKKKNLDIGMTEKQYPPNTISTKSESLKTNNVGPASPTIDKKSIDSSNVIHGNFNFMQSLQTKCDQGNEIIDNQEKINRYKTNDIAVDSNRDFDNNLKTMPQYCNVHASTLNKHIPVINVEDLNYTRQIHSANEKAVNENIVFNAKDYNSGVPISYDVNLLHSQINEILQSENIKEIINNAVRKSLTETEFGSKVVPDITQSTIDSKYNPCSNIRNIEGKNNPLSTDKELSHRIHVPNRPMQQHYLPLYNKPSFEISPALVTPMIIQAPDSPTVAISDKIIKYQPQVYTKISSSCTNPDNLALIKPNCSPIPAGIPNYPEICQPALDSSYLHCNPSKLETFPIDAAKLLETHATPCSVSNQNDRPTIQFSAPPNDKYTSLIGSSINNTSSVIVTNLLSTINTNIVNNIASSRKPISSLPAQIPVELTTLPVSIPQTSTSLDIPVFEITPPCVESPRYLPELSVAVNNTSSDLKTTSSTNSKTKHKHKSSNKEPCVSTITINVLPSVQQTSNDIIILV